MATESGNGESTQPHREVVLATANPGKAREIVDLLGSRWKVQSRPTDLAETIEDGETLEANATKKALEVATSTGKLALADDTGLFVSALGGAPGVRSARYAGPEADAKANVAKLLTQMEGVEERSAYFAVVIAVAEPDGRVRLAEGRTDGTIVSQARGESGFGYDPIFQPVDGDGRTFGEMTLTEKQSMSHRARALAQLTSLLNS